MAKRVKPNARADYRPLDRLRVVPSKAEARTHSRPAPRPTRPRSDGLMSMDRGSATATLIAPDAAPQAIHLVVPARPDADALASFQRALEATQRHQYAEAAEQFAVLIARYPSERGLLDRARVYLGHCQRELRRQPAEPKTVEERLTAATAALNLGEEGEAERFAESVLAEEPRQDLALYLMAVIAARREAIDAALAYLGDAIAVSPEVRAQARFDNDFEPLRDDDRFRQLVESPSVADHANSGRRARKGRPER